MAGLEVKTFFSEPTAAAYAYLLANRSEGLSKESRYVLVFDLGGGTLDVTVITAVGESFTVKTITGDSHLGTCLHKRHMFYAFKVVKTLTKRSLSTASANSVMVQAYPRRRSRTSERSVCVNDM